MDSDSWSDRLASASRRYQLDFLSRSDNFLGFEEIEGEDDFREEYACPFCSDYFDIVSLCCHIDEDHPMDAKNGVHISSMLPFSRFESKSIYCFIISFLVRALFYV